MSGAEFPRGGVINRNLDNAQYRMSTTVTSSKVTSLKVYKDWLFCGMVHNGCHVYKVRDDGCTEEIAVIGDKHDTCAVHQLNVSDKYLAYLKESNNQTTLCVHMTSDVLAGNVEESQALTLNRRAPMVLDPETQIIAIGGAAWDSSWTTGGGSADQHEENAERYIKILDVSTLQVTKQWPAVPNTLSLLRHQVTSQYNMLAAADSRTGLVVYDIRQPIEGGSYTCVYNVAVDEIRNFDLVGQCVGVFHRFEPNVSFWNLNEQKTILCINIADQMRVLAEELLETDEDEDDDGLVMEEDDHVTCVTSVPSEGGDYVIIYGTKSGCVFGISVNKRRKLFNIPCVHEAPDGGAMVRQVLGLQYVTGGKLAIAYDKLGLTMLDFSEENPPNRPPTRSQKRT